MPKKEEEVTRRNGYLISNVWSEKVICFSRSGLFLMLACPVGISWSLNMRKEKKEKNWKSKVWAEEIMSINDQ